MVCREVLRIYGECKPSNKYYTGCKVGNSEGGWCCNNCMVSVCCFLQEPAREALDALLTQRIKDCMS
jgi:hypothetical protein